MADTFFRPRRADSEDHRGFYDAGAIPLAHYLDYRDTFHLDAWWAVSPTKPANALLDESMQAVTRRHEFACARRSWGETVSLELMDGPRKVFSLQIAPRDRYLDATLVAA